MSYEGWGESAVLIAAAWMLLGHAIRIAQVFYGLALVAFGVAHLAYVRDTAALIPDWLPAHVAWVYMTAATYLAAGLAVLAGVRASPAATLSAVQMAAFTLLVWVPIVARGHADAAQHRGNAQRHALGSGAGSERREHQGDGRPREQGAGARQHEGQAKEKEIGVGRDRAENQQQSHEHSEEQDAVGALAERPAPGPGGSRIGCGHGWRRAGSSSSASAGGMLAPKTSRPATVIDCACGPG